MSERMDRERAAAVQARFWRGVLAWVAVGGAGLLAAVLLLFSAFPLGNAMTDNPHAGLRLATLWMGVSLLGMIASAGAPMIAIAARWSSWQDRLDAARRVLTEPAWTLPEWEETERGLRVCLERADDPEVRAALQRLQEGLRDAARRAGTAGVGSEADVNARELLALADATTRRLLAAKGPADVRDALALLHAHAEVERQGEADAVTRARMAARARARTREG